jgi:hypothetical protein
MTRADPKDVDANIEELTKRRWLTVNSAPAHYPY